MLTESENAWLKHRDIANPRGTYFCEYCKDYAECHSDMLWGIDECPTAPLSLHDAAEFEARVAAKLARIMFERNRYPCRGGSPQLGCMRDRSNLTGPMAVHCEDCILREVRLQVEEEMVNDT